MGGDILTLWCLFFHAFWRGNSCVRWSFFTKTYRQRRFTAKPLHCGLMWHDFIVNTCPKVLKSSGNFLKDFVYFEQFKWCLCACWTIVYHDHVWLKIIQVPETLNWFDGSLIRLGNTISPTGCTQASALALVDTNLTNIYLKKTSMLCNLTLPWP